MDFLQFIGEEIKKDYFQKLMIKIENEYQQYICYPHKDDLFTSLKLVNNNIKVVILGQDPYHNVGQAHGLAFSVLEEKLPPSLKNIFKELKSDLGITNTSGDLTPWALQGVLLLNTILSVRHNSPLSHKGYGWEIFSDNIISYLNNYQTPICFILWGNNAIAKETLITNKKHLILKSAHPSPLSAYNGFFLSRPFSKCNQFLINNGLKPIDWTNNKK